MGYPHIAAKTTADAGLAIGPHIRIGFPGWVLHQKTFFFENILLAAKVPFKLATKSGIFYFGLQFKQVVNNVNRIQHG
jgi:hypothetical protein